MRWEGGEATEDAAIMQVASARRSSVSCDRFAATPTQPAPARTCSQSSLEHPKWQHGSSLSLEPVKDLMLMRGKLRGCQARASPTRPTSVTKNEPSSRRI